MKENTFVLLFDYLVSTRIGNVIAAFLGVLLFYCICKLVLKIIDYIVFTRLVNSILDAIYDDEENEYFEPVSNREDKKSQMKNKKRDKSRYEKNLDEEIEFIKGKKKFNKKKQIVGVSKPVGRWTARAMKQWIKKHKNVDMNLINDLGYFQALVSEEKKTQDMNINV